MEEAQKKKGKKRENWASEYGRVSGLQLSLPAAQNRRS